MNPPENLEDYPDRVAETFKNKTILITGGTGFVGQILVEKLLRSCDDLKKMYLFMRIKKKKNPQERLTEMFSGPLFDLLKREKGEEILKKVEAIEADMETSDLALADEDRKKVMDEVEMIYHCAATTRFDEKLKKPVLLNVRATKLMLELAKECKKLIIFTHLSTAYCHLNEKILYEKIYPPPADPHKVIATCEWMDEKVLDNFTDKILGDIPNTYAFTKALAESLVCDEMENLPVSVLRPSVIIPVWKEPLPGWTDKIYGPGGLIIGAGKGIIRTMYCNGDNYADYVPVDIVVNAIMCSTFFYLQTKKNIYNITSSAEYKISFKEIMEIGREIVSTVPLNWVLWYPGGSMKKYRLHHYIDLVLFQLVPAVIVDIFLFLLGQKPFLTRLQTRIIKSYDIFEYFANNQWDFNNDASMEARKMQNPKEKALYQLDGDGINYHDYVINVIYTGRRYILKEPDDTIPMAKIHLKIMWFVDKVCKCLLLVGLFYLLMSIFGRMNLF